MLEDLINGNLAVHCRSKADFDTLDSILKTYARDEVDVPEPVGNDEAKENPYYYVSGGQATYTQTTANLQFPVIPFAEFSIEPQISIDSAAVCLADIL